MLYPLSYEGSRASLTGQRGGAAEVGARRAISFGAPAGRAGRASTERIHMTNVDRHPQLVTVEPATSAVVRGRIALTEIRDFFDRSFSVLGPAIGAQGATATGPAFGLYRGTPDGTLDLEVGFPTDRAVASDGPVEAGELPGGRVARLVHAGAFDGLAGSWQRLGACIAEQGPARSATYWEVYVTQPGPEVYPATLRTELNWLLA